MLKAGTLAMLSLALLVMTGSALAYIGPGAGISVLGSLLSILATIVVATGAILLWPVRKYLKRRKARRQIVPGTKTDNPDPDGAGGDT